MMIKLLPLIFLVSCSLVRLISAQERVLSPMINGSEPSKLLLQGNQLPGLFNVTVEFDGMRSHARWPKGSHVWRLRRRERTALSGAAGARVVPRGRGTNILTQPRGGAHSGASAMTAFPSLVMTSNTVVQVGLGLLIVSILFL